MSSAAHYAAIKLTDNKMIRTQSYAGHTGKAIGYLLLAWGYQPAQFCCCSNGMLSALQGPIATAFYQLTAPWYALSNTVKVNRAATRMSGAIMSANVDKGKGSRC